MFPLGLFAQGAQSAGSLAALPRRALVIGNDRYRDAPLKNPVNDARAIRAELEAVDFSVSTALDATLEQMRERIEAYGRELARDKAVGLFYFAGHGIQLSWRNYLLPVDTVIDKLEEVRDKAFDLGRLLELIGKAGNPANIVILDACRNNPFGRDFRVEQKGLSQVDAPVGTLLAYATAPGNVAIDGEGDNGLYTENLLREIRVPDAKVEDIFKRVRLSVRRSSKGLQIPWESTSLEDDLLPAARGDAQGGRAARQQRLEAEREARRKEDGGQTPDRGGAPGAAARRDRASPPARGGTAAKADRRGRAEEKARGRAAPAPARRGRAATQARRGIAPQARRRSRAPAPARRGSAPPGARRGRAQEEAAGSTGSRTAGRSRAAEETRGSPGGRAPCRRRDPAQGSRAAGGSAPCRRGAPPPGRGGSRPPARRGCRAAPQTRSRARRPGTGRGREAPPLRSPAGAVGTHRIEQRSPGFRGVPAQLSSGSFAELAQLRLDQLLARQGEQRVEIVNSSANPTPRARRAPTPPSGWVTCIDSVCSICTPSSKHAGKCRGSPRSPTTRWSTTTVALPPTCSATSRAIPRAAASSACSTTRWSMRSAGSGPPATGPSMPAARKATRNWITRWSRANR
ncbi:MAG: caspase family protein [Betaproteobacteria bacterium]|nr:caspase family protein [Betaproteobacteria bacterium]